MNRFGIWQKIEKSALDCLGLSLESSLSSRKNKLVIIRELRIHIEIVKHLCRVPGDLKIIEQRKYIAIQEKLQEISKMTSGWEKYLR